MRKFIILLLCLVDLSLAFVQGGEPYRGYKGYVDCSVGGAYNLNTAQTVSFNNLQLNSMISTTHGYQLNNWFVGGGAGYYHSFRDGENLFPIYATGRYSFDNVKMTPFVEVRVGTIYDALWVRKLQAYGSISAGITVYSKLQAGLRLSVYSRPSRYFTANAAVVLYYAIGK